MNVGATAEQPHLMRRLSRGLGDSKLGTSQEDNDDDNDEDDVNNPMALMRKVSKLGTTQEDNDDDMNNPMALMRKVSSGHARSMIASQSDSVMMEEGRRRRRRRKGAPAPKPPCPEWVSRSGMHRRRRGDCVDPEADVVNDPRRRSPGYQSP